jgi:hypothetical protein
MKTGTLLLLAGAGALAYYAWSKRSSTGTGKTVVNTASAWKRMSDGTCVEVVTTTYADGSTSTHSSGPGSAANCAPTPASGMGSYIAGIRRP